VKDVEGCKKLLWNIEGEMNNPVALNFNGGPKIVLPTPINSLFLI
jgi:hypothetical protein